MPGENVADWSTTAANNATADSSINWAEGQARASVNNSARSMMAAIAKMRNLENYSITTGGSANAQTFTSGVSYTSVPTGLRANLTVGFTNTASMTLNMDGIGAVTVHDVNGNTLKGWEFFATGRADVYYNGTNWIYLGPRQREYVHTAETTTSGATLDIKDLPTGTKELLIRISSLQPATDGAELNLLVSVDNGANWKTGASDYEWHIDTAVDTSAGSDYDISDSAARIAENVDSASSKCYGYIRVFFATGRTHYESSLNYDISSSTHANVRSQGLADYTCNAVQLLFSAGNISTITYSTVAHIG
jgi:hypothetical protein